ncbi:MAG: HDOD domain-containing protein [Desulfobacterales bacterium]|nr:HDOD domain-containing protein [Desulfobacterales bacterium]
MESQDTQTSIIDIIQEQVRKEESLPVLNPKGMEIQKEATKGVPDFKKLSALIRMDPTLTSQVLKTANSPFYRGLGDVETLKDAVVRLGQNEMVNIIMTTVLKQTFKTKVPLVKKYQTELWNHSVSCAVASSWLARHLAMEELIAKAFIAGLIHDMGKLYLLTALEKLIESKRKGFSPSAQLIEKILTSLHSEMGYDLLSKWNIPEQYRNIARDHHIEDYDASDVLLLLVKTANMVCNKMETNDAEQDISGIASSKEADLLGLTEIGVAELEIALEDFKFNNLMV